MSHERNVVADLVGAVTEGRVRLIDLSHPLHERTPMIELPDPLVDAPGWELSEIARYDERGPMYYWNSFSGSEHMGTHFDAPVHWITGRDGKDVSAIEPSELVGPLFVLDREEDAVRDPDYLLTVDDIKAFEELHGPMPQGAWLLFRTGWSRRHTDPMAFANTDELGAHWPGMDAGCAEYLAERTYLRGYGVEHIGIDAGQAFRFTPPYPAHHYLLGAGKYGLASLANLAELPTTGAAVIAAPLRIKAGSGSPARVYALVPRC